ncbi:MAG: hypothetical protein ACU83N_08855, partial [Gammaproteobacteria bacterium]
MKLRHVLALMLLLGLTAGFAQESNPLIEPGENKQKEIKVLPSPGNLVPGWWNYFSVAGSELKRRADEARQQYTRIVQQLDESRRATAGQNVEKFLMNLRTLYELTTAEFIQEPAIGPEKFKERYTIDEWLTFATRLQSEKIDVENQEARINRMRDEVKAADKK